ncbi:chorismate synthase [Streptomyces indicus]|uniref:Predicted acetyltransferase, GNAT superfamily n=1 Tax=Streptomyces indicus TaxID=417292 RepID=A0A1G9DWU1_9ACTN|nr:chorismate synthase [Streptomyces indicus]SDK68299.1 Predicted acetyltransferase, GNAT superfamily [Streptomyces indicus]
MTVTVRTVHDVAGIAAVADFFCDVWQTPRTMPPYPAEVLHSLAHAGGAVHAAYDTGGQLLGAAVAVFGEPAERDVYSFVAAARTSDRGTGLVVKRAQRDWAVQRGARSMRWTFDPLVGRNARFNLVKLGGRGTEYLVDFYGPMADGLNDGDESDRLTVTWDLTAPDPDPDPAGEPPAPAGELLTTAPDGAPLAYRDPETATLWCRVPDDIVKLRAADPELGLRWRHAVREVFTEAFSQGYEATAMSRDGWYTLTPRGAQA